jgi:hypothetical protein
LKNIVSLWIYTSGSLLGELKKLLCAEMPVDVLGGAFAIFGRNPPKNVTLVIGNNG